MVEEALKRVDVASTTKQEEKLAAAAKTKVDLEAVKDIH